MAEDTKPVGVIGAGSFGTAVANLLAINTNVLLFSRKQEVVDAINRDRYNFGVALSERIQGTTDFEEVAEQCRLIFPIVTAANFRNMMHNLGPFLRPYHILIHGTKGFDVYGIDLQADEDVSLQREHVSTMSEVIRQESAVVRVGCLSGPNLAKEIMDGQPTATVIGSHFDEVIRAGQKVLGSKQFHVFGSHDILGAELAGALKNIIAIGSGILRGKNLGKNIQSMLITRGLTEMIYFGQAMGATPKAFFGTAGIGDLVATATSKDSRNFTFGYRIGQGEEREAILADMPETPEGVGTLRIAKQLANYYKLRIPITQMIYNIVFHDFDIDKAIDFLMTFPYNVDVDFI